MEIPADHWKSQTVSYDPRPYIPYWEKKLRASIEKEPDASKRFELWLADKLTPHSPSFDNRGVRLVFIEQPYLAWAEMIERIISATDADTRERIAYEITHRDDGC